MKTQSSFATAFLGTTSIVSLQLLGVLYPLPTTARNAVDVANNNQSFLVSQATGSRIRFVPPVTKNPRQSQGAGSRGCGEETLGQNLVTLLIPSRDYIGQTISSHPTFSWYLSQPVEVPMQFTLVEDKRGGGGKTIWEKKIDSPQQGMIHVEIPKDRPELLPGKTYRWTISLVCNSVQPSANRYFISYIERVPITPALEQKLSATGFNRNSLPKTIPSGSSLEIRDYASLYAESGLWYDAVAALTTAIKQYPKDVLVQDDLFSLFNQVGLGDVAKQERQRLFQK
ncbi:DUF928 domain-containing protein [Allocoleopsis franciscana]|uniref:DUF928 domain-containing protein n=1 Tax=Allocoleopsis franciscana PCC 7113 TaxID=1173027 RepID=K9WDD5_9CYAN|nr:DUF928 domain-containing protein [Allocoleopsis franciscana]AFZ18410.1 protein of unknown function (DUF928) [Allocoleopsis franciscana PCC 7113]